MYHQTTVADFKLNLLGWERDARSPAAKPSATSGNRYQILHQPEAFLQAARHMAGLQERALQLFQHCTC
jgi:hypothetical protein